MTHCVAASSAETVGSLLSSTTGGASWAGSLSAVALVPGANVDGLDCLTADHCLATISDPGLASRHPEIVETDDTGVSWSHLASPSVPAGDWLNGMTCPLGDECFTVRDGSPQIVILRSTDGGHEWSSVNLSGIGATQISYLGELSCATAATCVAVGANTQDDGAVIVRTTDGGAVWQTIAVPAKAAQLSHVSCDEAGTCIALGGGNEALESSTTGKSWTRGTLPSGMTGDGVHCASGGSCLVVGSSVPNEGASARTSNGGVSWKLTLQPPHSGSLDSISCASPAYCVAIRQDDNTSLPAPTKSTGFAITSNGGSAWADVASPNGIVSLNGVACPSAESCFAVGGMQGRTRAGVIFHSADNGDSWALEDTVVRVGNLAAVECPSAGTCVAVGEDPNWDEGSPMIVTTTDGGSSWHSRFVGNAITGLRHLACPSAEVCLGSGTTSSGAGRLLRWTIGAAPQVVWKAPSNVYIQGLACHGPALCLAVGAAPRGAAVVRSTDVGAHWSELSSPKNISIMRQLSCPTSTTCFAPVFDAANDSRVAVTHDAGVNWTLQQTPSVVAQFTAGGSIACSDATHCMLVGLDNGSDAGSAVTEMTTDGMHWSSQATPGDVTFLLGVAATKTLFVAVGADGAVLTQSA